MNLQIIWGLEENGVVSDYINWYDYSDGHYTPATITDYPSVPRLSVNGKIRSLGIDCQLLTNN